MYMLRVGFRKWRAKNLLPVIICKVSLIKEWTSLSPGLFFNGNG